VLADPVAGLDTDTLVTGGSEPVAARLAYRDRVCEHLTIAGECPLDGGQVLISARTATEFGLAPGDVVTARFAGGIERRLEVAGTYQPRDPGEWYWGRSVYFTYGGFDPTSGAPRVDAMFTVAEADVQADPGAVVNLTLTYPLRVGEVRLDQVPRLRAALASVGAAPEDVVRSVVYVVSADSAEIGGAWHHFAERTDLAPAFKAASTVVGVTALGYPDQLVELDLTASLPA